MKTAVVSSGHIPSSWAHSVAVARNANGFHHLGHDVRLLSVERWYESRTDVDDVTGYYGIADEIDVRTVTDRTPYYFEDVFPLNYALDALDYATWGFARRPFDPEKALVEMASDVDLCFCRTYRAVQYAVERGVPTVMESHTPVVRKPGLRKALALSDWDAFRALVTISDDLADTFADAGVPREKILVLQDGVDLEQFADAPGKEEARRCVGFPADGPTVVYCGSLHEDKGIRHVLQVAARLPDVSFRLVGGSEADVTEWRSVADDLGCPNVHFVGYVDPARVPTYLRAADVLVMPYKTDHEITLMDLDSTSPLKLFEYMAAGRPIVTTDIPAIARTLDHGVDGLLAAPNDIDELTAYVERALRDDEFAERLADNARDAVEDYTWKERCRKIVEHAGVA